MSILDNIGNNLDKQFENFNYLPQKLALEDLDQGVNDFIQDLKITVDNENGNKKQVPIIYLSQELWAEKKGNWSNMRNENGEEITRPFMALKRTSVKQGTSPLKRSIPVRKKFAFVKVPKFDGTLKGYDLYKIPQPTYVDCDYELVFVTHYMEDVNVFYESIIRKGFTNLQGYMKINGYDISARISDPSENNTIDQIDSERLMQISIPIQVFGKLVDPTEFEKVNTITKIAIKISEG